jgi:hypothetical protein
MLDVAKAASFFILKKNFINLLSQPVVYLKNLLKKNLFARKVLSFIIWFKPGNY